MTLPLLDPVEIRLLQQLFASATNDASAAMCRWTNGLVTLTLDEVRDIPLEEVASEFQLGDELLTMVVLTLAGDKGGTMILTFDEHNGRALAAALLGKAPRDPSAPWTELEISAVNETGNILGCAYLNALTRLVAVELVPSPPYFIQDYAASVLDQALAPLAGECDVVTICRTNFRREGQDLNWNVLFIPTPGLRQALSEALHSNP